MDSAHHSQRELRVLSPQAIAGDQQRHREREATTVTAAPRVVIAAGSCADCHKRVTTPAEQRDSASDCDASSGVSTDLAPMCDLRIGNFCEGWGISATIRGVGRSRPRRGSLYDSYGFSPDAFIHLSTPDSDDGSARHHEVEMTMGDAHVFEPAESLMDITDAIHEVGPREETPVSDFRRALDTAASEVLVRVAHEMRQPLSAVSTAIAAVKDDSDPARRAHACQVLERQCTRLSRLVEDLLVVARTGRDITALNKDTIDLHRVLLDLAEAIRPVAAQRHQQLEVLLSPGPCWIEGDAVRLEQVFSNILNNAIKYTEDGGRIWLTSVTDNTQAVVTVGDTGRGIPPDVLATVFEMFTTGPDKTEHGLGVGLAVARHLVTLHGGSIRITSDRPEGGTEVMVTLPHVDAPARPAGSELPPPPRPSAAEQHVRRMLDRIEQSYSEPITLRSLAAELHRQSAYLGGMFRRVVGVSVHQWLTNVRLDRASTLIRDGVKVEAVSLLVGYRSKKNFYRQFKRRFGTTPVEHRNAARTGA